MIIIMIIYNNNDDDDTIFSFASLDFLFSFKTIL